MFPTRDMTDAATRFYDLEQICGWILYELRRLEIRLQHWDSDPYLTLDLAEGRRLVIGRMTTGVLTRWVVAELGDLETTVHEVQGKDDYARSIREVLVDAELDAAAR